ncbi:uncharacterized protein LOC129582304 [Paramacrobiotus metropolitanus]|uniref:uncharacterized protein LOC129582304 n=1 Tax=Paramacrobiotus metropolitanus TaxID=2943436 RepID=UPI00244596AF|nr:uncharacterized protein LOC129582304 [Paramacrobiotus metropolitanus]
MRIFTVLITYWWSFPVGCQASVEACIKPAHLQYITGQVDLNCLQMARQERSAGGGPPANFPFPANMDAIPKSLLEVHADMRELLDTGRQLRMARKDDQLCTEKGCYDLPNTMCETTSDVVTPINATSATSGETVWIAQYPGLFIQTITYTKCKQSRCYYLNGACKQTFSPYLLITHPPGPVSIFGQDYVLVESGCTCEPEVSGNRSLNNNMEMFLPHKGSALQHL